MTVSPLGAAHVAAALAALAFGLFVVLAAKGTQLHRALGMAYAMAMIALNLAALLIYRMTGHSGPFHVLALVSLAPVLAGIGAAIRQRPNWLSAHYRMMIFSYLGLLAATSTEIAIRVPALHVNNPARGTMVGVASAVAFTAIGFIIVPRLQRRALAAVASD